MTGAGDVTGESHANAASAAGTASAASGVKAAFKCPHVTPDCPDDPLPDDEETCPLNPVWGTLVNIAGKQVLITKNSRYFFGFATPCELEKLPCIGPSLARMIWEFSNRWGHHALYVGPLMIRPPYYSDPHPVFEYFTIHGRKYFDLEDITYPSDFNEYMQAYYGDGQTPPTARELAGIKKQFRRDKSFHYVYGFNRKRLECIAGETPRMKLMGIKSTYSFILDDPELPKYQVPD